MSDLSLGIPDAVAAATGASLVVVLQGRDDQRLQVDVAEQLTKAGAHDVYVLPTGQGAELLAARERAFWLVKAAGADDLIEMVVPRDKIPAYLQRVQELAGQHDSRVFGCGHAGDGNINFSVYQPDESRRTALLRATFEAGMGMGGAISGEHGIGRSKKEHHQALEGQGGLRPDGSFESGVPLRSRLNGRRTASDQSSGAVAVSVPDRSRFPDRSAVRWPSATIRRPLTRTWSMPSASA
jgi:FAD/FMN-containing dehydrogenase